MHIPVNPIQQDPSPCTGEGVGNSVVGYGVGSIVGETLGESVGLGVGVSVIVRMQQIVHFHPPYC